MKICTYSRVSTKDGGQDVQNQLAQLHAFAESQGWKLCANIRTTVRASGRIGLSSQRCLRQPAADSLIGAFLVIGPIQQRGCPSNAHASANPVGLRCGVSQFLGAILGQHRAFQRRSARNSRGNRETGENQIERASHGGPTAGTEGRQDRRKATSGNRYQEGKGIDARWARLTAYCRETRMLCEYA